MAAHLAISGISSGCSIDSSEAVASNKGLNASLASLTATRLRPPAQGWPLRLPWDCGSKFIQPRSGCVISSTNQRQPQPPCGWESTKVVPRVAETANPGLKGATALRFAEKVDSSRT